MPYSSEGFGLVIIEAMSFRQTGDCLKRATNSGYCDGLCNRLLPFPEKVTTYMEKVYIEPFVEKILYLVENPAARENMGIEGRKRVEGKYSTDIVMKQIERLYEAVTYK